MAAASPPSPTRLSGMLVARVPAGFGDQIRAAARAEGLRPGALIRGAIAERIERAARASGERSGVVAFDGERFERSSADQGRV